MKIKLPNIKISKALFSLRYFYILIFILLVISLAILARFLHENFYKTIAQSEEIIILKQEVAPDIIDVDKVENVLKRLNKKIATEENFNLNNLTPPFEPTQPAPLVQDEDALLPEPGTQEATSTPE